MLNEHLEHIYNTSTYDGILNYEENKEDLFLLALINGMIVSNNPRLSARYEMEKERGKNDTLKERVDL